MIAAERKNIPLKNSRQAKISFAVAMFNVVYFFLLHAVIEAFLLGGRANPAEPLGNGMKLLYYVLPVLGMAICIIGAIIAVKDLRRLHRSREFAMMGFVINLVIFTGLIILICLTVTMA